MDCLAPVEFAEKEATQRSLDDAARTRKALESPMRVVKKLDDMSLLAVKHEVGRHSADRRSGRRVQGSIRAGELEGTHVLCFLATCVVMRVAGGLL